MRIFVISAWVLINGFAGQVAAQDSPAAAPQPKATSQQTPSASLGLYVFPAKGQTADQQKQDEQACYTWAQEQSGIDPVAVKANPDSARKAAGAGGSQVLWKV